jgi:glutathione S-transferase
MERIYHLALRTDWEGSSGGEYRPASLAGEGFIHCSFAGQVARSANRFFADAGELLLLEIDPAGLSSPLRNEPAAGELFPHVYGPLDRAAVAAVHVLKRDAGGRWVFP